MRFYKYLYLTDAMEKKKDKIIKKLQKGSFPLSYYLLVLAEDGENQLEFYSSAFLRQVLLCSQELFVVGIAESQMEAIYLVEEIAEEVYEHTGELDIRSYILSREQQ